MASHRPVPIPPAAPESSSARGWQRHHSLAMVVTFALAAVLLFWLWSRDDERAALADLPRLERASLYARTRTDLQTTCRSSDRALDAYCEHQAQFILKFPECDADCRELASHYLPHATR